MRICHFTTVHHPKDARIFYRMCQPLAERGHSVVIVAPWKFSSKLPIEMSPWNSKIAQANRFNRARLALKALLAEYAEVYHFHDPELIPIALILKALRPRTRVVYDVHEDYPAMMKEKYWLPKPIRSFTAWAVQLSNIIAGRCFDGIVTADSSVQQDFQRSTNNRTLVHNNFPPLSLFETNPSTPYTKKFDLVYVGGMSVRAGTFVLLDALVLLAKDGLNPSVRLAGYTDGEAGLSAIKNGIQSRNLDSQIELSGKIPYSQVPDFNRSGRIGLVTLQPVKKFLKNIPSKMFEYWACGLPVIASNLPPIRQFLSDGENGLLFDPTCAESLASVIRRLLDSPEKREAMGRKGQENIFRQWNNDRQTDNLIFFYTQICKGHC